MFTTSSEAEQRRNAPADNYPLNFWTTQYIGNVEEAFGCWVTGLGVARAGLLPVTSTQGG